MKRFLVDRILRIIKDARVGYESDAFDDVEHNERIAENLITVYNIESVDDIKRNEDDIKRVLFIILSIRAGAYWISNADSGREIFSHDLASI